MRLTVLGVTTVLTALTLTLPVCAQGKADLGAKKPGQIDLSDANEISTATVFAGKNLDQWVRDLQSPNPSSREAALHVIPQYGKAARTHAKAVHDIIGQLFYYDTSVRVNAAIALGVIGLPEAEVKTGVRGLLQLTRDPEAVVRLQAVIALARIGPDAKDAIGQLTGSIHTESRSWETRKAAALALGNIAMSREGPDLRALNALSSALSDLDKDVRMEAMHSLIKLGPPAYDPKNPNAEAKRTKENVERRLLGVTTGRNTDSVLKIWAHVALLRMTYVAERTDKGTEKHIDAITKMLTSTDLTTRVQACQALGLMGPEAKHATPNLIEALKHDDPTTRVWAAGALGAIHEHDKTCVPALVAALGDAKPEVRAAAAQALGSSWAAAALGDGVQGLIKLLGKEKEPQVAAAAIWALGQIGAPAKPALPALERVVKEEEEVLKRLASESISRISGQKPAGKDNKGAR
jgi:HEAT repeat protein